MFERAYASVPLTLPSHTTILTGLEPLEHGVHDNGSTRVPPEVETLAELLDDAGYDTAAFVSAFVLDPRFDLDQGFHVYGAETRREIDPLAAGVPQRSGAEVTDEALAWLESREGEAPFFLWAHYYDPHTPRDVEPPFDALPDAYRGEIAYADAQLGRLLEGVGDAKGGRETVIVFTADHGESLGQHAEATHGILAYDSTLRVPLILVGRSIPAGERTDIFARHVDLLPTILPALGLPVPEHLPGRDLVAAATSGSGREDAPLGYFESRGSHADLGWAPIEGARTPRWKYTASPEPVELYDVQEDPDERRNLAEERDEVVTRMDARLRALREARSHPDRESRRVTLAPEDLEQLAALGYVQAGGGAIPAKSPIRAASWPCTAGSSRRAATRAAAASIWRSSCSKRWWKHPRFSRWSCGPSRRCTPRRAASTTQSAPTAVTSSSPAAGARGSDWRAPCFAQVAPRRCSRCSTSSDRGSVTAALLRARALARLGRHAEARRVVDARFANAEPARLRARMRLVLDSAPLDDGETELRSLLSAGPDDPFLRSALGFYLAVWGADARDEALALLRGAAAAAPEEAEIQANLGWGLHRLDLADDAIAPLEAALALDSSRHQDRVRLASVLHHTGRDPERALDLVRAALARRPAAPWAEEARSLRRELEAELGDASVGADAS